MHSIKALLLSMSQGFHPVKFAAIILCSRRDLNPRPRRFPSFSFPKVFSFSKRKAFERPLSLTGISSHCVCNFIGSFLNPGTFFLLKKEGASRLREQRAYPTYFKAFKLLLREYKCCHSCEGSQVWSKAQGLGAKLRHRHRLTMQSIVIRF